MRILAILLLLGLSGALHAQKLEKATFAGGCFWCTEEAFEKLGLAPGAVVSGYMGGKVKNPSYEQVSTGRTGTPRWSRSPTTRRS